MTYGQGQGYGKYPGEEIEKNLSWDRNITNDHHNP